MTPPFPTPRPAAAAAAAVGLGALALVLGLVGPQPRTTDLRTTDLRTELVAVTRPFIGPLPVRGAVPAPRAAAPAATSPSPQPGGAPRRAGFIGPVAPAADVPAGTSSAPPEAAAAAQVPTPRRYGPIVPVRATGPRRNPFAQPLNAPPAEPAPASPAVRRQAPPGGRNPFLSLVDTSGTLTAAGRANATGTPTGTPTRTPTVTSTVLRRGDVSPDVRALQEALNSRGAQLVVDAIFGPRTEAAVRAFQATERLLVDGVAGPLTRSALTAP